MNHDRRKFDWILLTLILLAIAARVLAMFYSGAMYFPGGEDKAIAVNLLENRGFSFAAFQYQGPTSCRAPVYPFLLEIVYAIFGTRQNGTFITLSINAIVGAISVLAAYRVGRNLFHKRVAALLLALGVTIWPTQLHAATYQQGLSVGIALLLTMLATLTSPKPDRAPLAGLLAGLAVLTESILVIPVAFVIATIAARKPGAAIITLLMAFCIVTPWVYRNALVHNEIVGVTNNLWADVYKGNGDGATGSQHLKTLNYAGKPQTRIELLTPRDADSLKKQTEAQRNELFRRWSLNWIEANPLAYAKLCAVRIAKLLWLDWDHPLAWKWVNVLARTLLLIGLIVAIMPRRFLGRRRAVLSGDVLDQPSQLHEAGVEKQLNARYIAIAIALGLVAASVFTLAEARNAAFIDIAQLLAIASMADTKRQSER